MPRPAGPLDTQRRKEVIPITDAQLEKFDARLDLMERHVASMIGSMGWSASDSGDRNGHLQMGISQGSLALAELESLWNFIHNECK